MRAIDEKQRIKTAWPYTLRDIVFMTVNAMHTPIHIAYTLRDIVFVTVSAMHASMASILSTYFIKEVQMITSSVTVLIYAQVNVQAYSILTFPKIEEFTDHIPPMFPHGNRTRFSKWLI